MAHQLVLAKTGDAICNTETANPIALATPANPDNDSSIPNHTSRKTSSEQSSRARQSWQVVVNLNSETTKPSSRRLSAVSPKTPNRRPGSPSVTSESSSPDRTNLVRSSQSSSTRGLTQSESGSQPPKSRNTKSAFREVVSCCKLLLNSKPYRISSHSQFTVIFQAGFDAKSKSGSQPPKSRNTKSAFWKVVICCKRLLNSKPHRINSHSQFPVIFQAGFDANSDSNSQPPKSRNTKSTSKVRYR